MCKNRTSNELSIFISQKNLNRQTEAAYLFSRQNQNSDIFLIQEPFFSKFRTFGLQGAKRTIYDTSATKPLTVIACNNRKLQLIKVPECSELITTCLIAERGYQNVLVINCYFPPNKSITNALKSISSAMKKHSTCDVLLCGDFNSRHTEFGDVKSNTRGKQLLEFVRISRLTICNSQTLPTFIGPRGSSKIDLVFHRSDNYNSNVKCNIDRDCDMITDHSTIQIKLTVRQTAVDRPASEYIPVRMNNEEISIVASELNIPEDVGLDSTEKIDDYFTLLTTRFNSVKASKFAGASRRTIFQSDWWTNKLERLRSAVLSSRRHLQVAKRTNVNIDEAKANLNLARNKYRYEIRKVKRTNWRNSCSKSEPWDVINKIAFDKIKSKENIDYIDTANGPITDTNQMCTIIQKRFFPADETTLDTVKQRNTRLAADRQYMNNNFDSPITLSEINTVLKEHNPDKAPGYDQITLRQWKIIFEFQPRNLLNALNRCFFSGYFPRIFKRATISLIRKPGKRSNEVSSFRPISLLPVMGKIFEAIINKRLIYYLHEQEHINSNQYGFVKGKTTADLLHDVVSKIGELRKSRRRCALIQIDIASAFDRAWHCEILNQIKLSHVPGHLYRVIESYLKEREVTINIHNQNSTLPITRGCPQGSILGPSLWNLTIFDILKLEIPDTTIFAYADDLLLLCSSKSNESLIKTIENAIKFLKTKLTEIKLDIATEKLKILRILTRGEPATIRVNIDGEIVESVDNIFHLGIYIDNKLSWNRQIEHLKSSADLFINKTRRIAKTTWGINEKIRNLLYEAVIIPKMTYASSLWFHKFNYIQYRKKFDQIQRFILTNLFGYWKTVSSAAVQVLTNKKPLYLDIIDSSLIYMLKRGKRISGFSEIIHNDFGEMPGYLGNKLNSHPSDNVYTLATNLSTRSRQDVFAIVDVADWQVVILVKRPGRATIAKRIILNTFLSERDAKLTALIEAANLIDRNVTTTHIYIDDPQVLRLSIYKKSELENRARLIYTNKKIRVIATNSSYFLWMRNQLIVRKDEIEIIAGTYRTFSVEIVKKHLNNQSKNWWQTKWQTTDTGAHTKSIFPSIIERNKIKLPDSYELRQLLSGHGRFRAIMHRFGHSNVDTCPCSRIAIQTSHHLLFECPRLNEQRESLTTTINVRRLTCDNLIKAFSNTDALAKLIDLARRIFEFIEEHISNDNSMVTITGRNLEQLINRVRHMNTTVTEEEHNRVGALTNLPVLNEDDHRYIG